MNLSMAQRKQIGSKLLAYLSLVLFSFILGFSLPDSNRFTAFFYSMVIILAVFFADLAELSKNYRLFYNIFLFISFFILFYIYGFRNFTATDDPSYIRIFTEVANIGWFDYFKMTTMEPGYLLLNRVISLFTSDYLYMQLITSFIPLFLFYIGFHKYRNSMSLPMGVFLLCVMLYFQMLAVGLVRMFIAMAIIFNALQFIPQLKPKKYITYVIMASLIHYSSFIMIFLVYFAINKLNLKNNVKKIYLLTLVIAPIAVVFISRVLVPILGSRYQGYSEIGSINLGLEAFTTLPIIILFLYFYKYFTGEESLEFKFLMFLYSLSLVISIFGDMIGLGRLIFYSYCAFILLASKIYKKINDKTIGQFFGVLLIFYGLLYLYFTQFLNINNVPTLFPYINIFFQIY